MMNYFTFDGVDSRDFNTFIATSNMFDAPEENVETIHIPYKNTPLHISEKTFKPFILKALCYIPDNMQNNIDELRNFLKSKFASCRYTEALRPGEFRMARFKSAFEVERSDRQTAAFVLTFECAPQRYIIDNPTLTLTPTTSEATSYSLSTPAMPLPLTLEGNTTQAGSSGKNKLGLANGTYSSNGITAVVNNGVVTVSGSTGSSNVSIIDIPIATISSSLGTVTKSLNPTGTYTGLQTSVRNSSGSSVGLWTTDASNATASLSGDGTYLRIQANTDITINCTIKPQIEVGSTATAYEPCLSPLTPQEIHSVKGDNEIRVVGKNLCSPFVFGVLINNSNGAEGTTATSAATDFIPVDFNTNSNYYLSGLVNTLYSFVAAYNAEKQFLGRTGAGADTVRLLTSSRFTGGTAQGSGDIRYLRITEYENSSVTGTIDLLNSATIQLEVGSTATTYEPYKAQVYPINLGSIELNALGTYKDYFYKSDGKWYLHKAIQKIDVGTLTWARRATNIFGSNLPNGTDVTADISAHMSNYFPIQYVTGVVNTQINTIAIYKTSNITSTTNIYISLANIDTVEELTTWFNSHATELYYPLATPTNTEITDTTLISQLNALSKAKTYDGSTTIVQDGTDAQFKLSMPVPTEISSEYFGEPIITVNEVGTIVWNDSLIKVNSAPVTINSQTLQCYYYSENKNNDVEINEFPKYEQGENYIGSTMDMSVVPNYWKL